MSKDKLDKQWDALKAKHPEHVKKSDKLLNDMKKGATAAEREKLWLAGAMGELQAMIDAGASFDQVLDAVQIVLDNRELNKNVIVNGVQ